MSIQPGTIVTFGPGARLLINGALSAVGTASSPIRFVGGQAIRGYWHGIYISSNSIANELSFVEVLHGGGGANAAGITVEAFGRLVLANSSIKESAGSGLYAGHDARLPSFTSNRFQNNATAGVRIPDDLVGSLDVASDYATGNGRPYLDVYADEISTSQTWRVTGVPIRFAGTSTVWQALAIAPGVTVQFGANSGWTIKGSLTAVGTATSPIRFVGVEANRGYWRGLTFSSNSDANELSFVEVAHAGGVGGTNAANVTLDGFAHLGMRNTILRESAGSGLYAGHASKLPVFTANSLRNNAGSGIRLPDDLVGALDTGTDYTTGNGKNYLDVYGDDVNGSQTWRVTSAPLRFSGTSTIWGSLAISAGVNMTMAANARLNVRGSLTAIGTASSMIRIVGEQAVRGYWEGIYFGSNSASNEFAYVEVAHGGGVGGTTAANIVVESFDRLRLTNTTLRESAGWGLFVQPNGVIAPSPVASGANTMTNNTRGGSNVP